VFAVAARELSAKISYWGGFLAPQTKHRPSPFFYGIGAITALPCNDGELRWKWHHGGGVIVICHLYFVVLLAVLLVVLLADFVSVFVGWFIKW
jgi:hypothetical protein